MTYMLDTNICIFAIRNSPAQVVGRIQENLSKGLCISAITLAELEHGVAKSRQSEENNYALLRLMAIMDVLPFDDSAAVEYGKICAYLQKQGMPIGTMDMLIAGHARAEQLTLVTHNVREFVRVPDLAVEDWAAQ